jgi:hypothetical protein
MLTGEIVLCMMRADVGHAVINPHQGRNGVRQKSGYFLEHSAAVYRLRADLELLKFGDIKHHGIEATKTVNGTSSPDDLGATTQQQ